MEFKDKYISCSDKEIDKNSKKKVLSDDAFALCEQLDRLTTQLYRSGKRG